MKPIIIYTNDSDKLVFTKEEFEKYMQEAYNQGYWCGAVTQHIPYISWNDKETIPAIQWKDYITTSNLKVGD